jgi:hypothetical protein
VGDERSVPVGSCVRCRRSVEARYRFCPWCAAPQRGKLVEFFPAAPVRDDEAGKALRVSRYLDLGDGPRHVRFSVWHRTGVAEAAVSLDEAEAARLARFLAEPAPATLDEGLTEPIRMPRGL